MDLTQLAKELALFLTPFLPYLLKAGDQAVEKMGEQVGEQLVPGLGKRAWQSAQTLWSKLRPKVQAKPAAQEAAQDVASAPDDKDSQTALSVQLKKFLLDDPPFAQDLARAWDDAQAARVAVFVTGDHTIGIGGSVSQSIVNAGTMQLVLGADTSPEELTRAYLRSLAAECSKLPLGTIAARFLPTGDEHPVPLQDIYVDLDVQAPARERATRAQRAAPPDMEARSERTPILAALGDPKLQRIVLLGDPGSGKSTFVQYLAFALAQIQLHESNAAALLPDQFVARDLFPVRLVLREVAAQHIPAHAPKGDAGMLWNALRADLTTRLGADAAGALFPVLQKRLLREGGLILLDGLDEVPSTDHRRARLLEAISAFEQLLPASRRIIVTARPYAYADPKWQLPKFETLILSSFSQEQIERFIERWYQAMRETMGWNAQTAQGTGAGLQSAIRERAYLADLAQRPLLLTLMATLHTSWGKLPDDRADLYEESVKLLLIRWQTAREVRRPDGSRDIEPGIAKTLAVEEKAIRQALHRLAFTVHARQGKENQRDDVPADIRADEVLAAFCAVLPDDTNANVVLQYLEERAGLLLSRAPGIYTFPHRSFQEFLAACYLLDQPQSAQALRAKVWEDATWWREVFLLGVGRKRVFSLDDAVNVVNTLVPACVEETENIGEVHWRAATLAGYALAEMNLASQAEGQAHYEAILKRIRHWLVVFLEGGSLTPRDRAEAGDALAQISDPRPGVGITPLFSGEGQGERLPDLVWCEIPAGPFLMGSHKEDRAPYDDEQPQFTYTIRQNFYIARYPITNAQFDAFVNDPNGYRNDQWWTKAGLKWRGNRVAPDKSGGAFDLPNHPVVNVTWYESFAFARWLDDKLKGKSEKLKVWRADRIEEIPFPREASHFQLRLPTEAEWEKAARSTDGRVYSWGSDADPNRMNFDQTGLGVTNAVGAFPGGASPYGVLEMSGNVWEWCQTKWTENYQNYAKTEDNDPEGDTTRVVRGGSSDDRRGDARCASRGGGDPVYYWSQGWRLVLSPIRL